MAEEQDSERELPASQKRLDDARERGQVPRSRELTTAVALIAGAGAMLATGPALFDAAGGFLQQGLTLSRASAFDTHVALEQARLLAWRGCVIALPLIGTMYAAALISQLAIGGWVFTTVPLAPDFTRLNPIKGLANMVSANGLAELAKTIFKIVLVGGTAAWLMARDAASLVAPLAQSPREGYAFAGALVTRDFVFLAATMMLIAAADVPLQLWRHAKSLRMSKAEAKREQKENDGDPRVKGKIRARQREMARRRMMSAVPKADVVITNPTHYAVALSYNGDSMRAPRVVAKGSDEVAARIREIAAEHGVPLLEAPPLARALYAHAELEEDIPAALYNAVAQALAYVYQLRNLAAGPRPQAPTDIPVPAELDPQAESGGARA
jgi:flagellar biosynthetic protein FlhB